MRQIYENYTADDQQVWQILYKRQYPKVSRGASKDYLTGIESVQFHPARIPVFDEINQCLNQHTSWQLAVVPGLVPDYTFFELMSYRHFPATTWLRKKSQIDYLQEPDMFHDVFAHVPLLSNVPFTRFLEGLSRIGLQCCGNDEAIEYLARLYWFSVEFGLIKEKDTLKIYGAGILSSAGETEYSLSDKPPKYPFDVAHMMDTPFRKDVFQKEYFVIDSYEELYQSIDTIKSELARRCRIPFESPQVQHH